MNRKLIYALAATLIAIVAVIVVLWRAQDFKDDKAESLQNETASQHQAPTDQTTPSISTPAVSGSKVVDAQHKEDVRKGLEAIVEGLKQMGAKEVPPIAETLKEAIATGVPGDMRRAFHEATYGRFARMGESIPAMKEYLDSPDPYVRYLAAEALIRVGDQSGIDGLVQFISIDQAVLKNGSDLRIEAARQLGKYGDGRASAALMKLYETTKNGSVLNALARIEADSPSAQLLSEIERRQSPGYVAFNLGLVGLPQGEPIVREALKNPQVPSNEASETRMIAAWALAQNLNDASALSYLSRAAQPAIERKETSGQTYDDSTKALKYLGSVQSPQAVKVLEQALDSQNPVAVQYATVNLLFNQPGGSEKAEQLVLKELQASPKKLGIDLTMQIASKLDNPEIKEAAKAYDLRTGGDRWRYWGEERSNWPIENWAYDYAVTLNR